MISRQTEDTAGLFKLSRDSRELHDLVCFSVGTLIAAAAQEDEVSSCF